MELQELIKKVRKIEIRSRLLSNQQFAGAYHTAFKGRGMQFNEVREYAYGDDIRHIEWNVSARMRSPYVKLFQEEREQTVLFMVDVSPSVFASIGNTDRKELIAELVATLAFSAIRSQDKVGLLLFDHTVRSYIPPARGFQQVLQIIRSILDAAPQAGSNTNLRAATDYLKTVYKRNALIFLLSDFLFDGYKDTLSLLAARNDLVGIAVKDPLDDMLPDIGLVQVVDAETGQPGWVDTSSKAYKSWYQQQSVYRNSYFRKTFSEINADTLLLSDKEDYVRKLQGFFHQRARKR